MCGMTSRQKYTALRKLALMARCQSSSEAARNPFAGGPPAFVTQISTLPNLFATAATNAATAVASVTSTASVKTSTLCCLRIFCAAAASACSFRAHIARRHPSAANASAVASPRPWLDAATKATRFLIPRSMEVRNYKWLFRFPGYRKAETTGAAMFQEGLWALSCGLQPAPLLLGREEFMTTRKRRPETAAVRGASDLEKKNPPVTPPIYQTSTFEVTDNEEQIRVTTTDRYYTRWGNPTITLAEQTLAAVEGTDSALVFASGMGAITTTVLALLKAGDHVVAQRDIYGGVTKFFSEWLPKLGIETTFVATNGYEQHQRAIRPNTKMLYVESPTNPSLLIVDMKKTAAIAKQHRLISMIDSTFGTPINQRPAEHGFDLVMHSGTKYLSGHADLTCGAICGRGDLIEQIGETRKIVGNCMDPHAA